MCAYSSSSSSFSFCCRRMIESRKSPRKEMKILFSILTKCLVDNIVNSRQSAEIGWAAQTRPCSDCVGFLVFYSKFTNFSTQKSWKHQKLVSVSTCRLGAAASSRKIPKNRFMHNFSVLIGWRLRCRWVECAHHQQMDYYQTTTKWRRQEEARRCRRNLHFALWIVNLVSHFSDLIYR